MGGEKAAEKFGVPFLGRIPLDAAIRQGGDAGMPIVVADPSSPQAETFKQIAKTLEEQTTQSSSEGQGDSPSLSSLLQKIKKPLDGN